MLKFTVNQEVTYAYLLFLYTIAYKNLFTNTQYYEDEVELVDLSYNAISSIWLDPTQNTIIYSFDCE
jgi:hypothetical protein